MLKTLALVAAGLAAGFAVAFWLVPGAETAAGAAVSAGPFAASGDAAASSARVAALEEALAAEVGQRAALETLVEELAAQVEELRGTASRPRDARAADESGPRPPDGVPQFVRERFARGGGPLQGEELERRQIERLIAAGFAPDRAEWINRRMQELQMAALQAEYDARREGRALDPAGAPAVESTLRAELGDVDYEHYLEALNRPTSVPVLNILASSPAERAGLRAGDEVVAYGGQRVFDVRDLNALTLQGTAGESVVVDVRRGGQTLQLVVPRGPLGISGGFRGPVIPAGR